MKVSRNHWRSLTIGLATLAIALAATTAQAQRSDRDDPGSRLRLGGEAGVGAAVGDTQGGAFALIGQLGLQANDLFAVYWKPGLHVNGWAAGDDDLSAYLFTSQLAMVDFTFAHWFQIGGGGGVDIGRLGVCEGNDCESRTGQVKPAIEGRVGFIIPMTSDRVRWGIPIMFNAHTTFLGGGERIHSLTGSVGILRY
jgi:hypothetical protein